jgi:hypothetical protein
VNIPGASDITPDRPLPNSYWVIRGSLLAGEHPAGADPTETSSRLQQLSRAGIDCFIDLTEPGELPDYFQLLLPSQEYYRSAIADTGVPNSLSQTMDLILSIRMALGRGRRIYVHCRAGIGRTGLIVGCFLAEQEGSGKAGMKELNRLWKQCGRSYLWPTIPQTQEQTDYVRHWPKMARKLVAESE